MNTAPVNQNANSRATAMPDDEAQLKEACQQFESILVNQLVSAMRASSLKSNDFFGEDHQSEMYEQMLDQEISNSISHQQGIGLADLIFQQLTGKPEEGTR